MVAATAEVVVPEVGIAWDVGVTIEVGVIYCACYFQKFVIVLDEFNRSMNNINRFDTIKSIEITL